MKTKSIALISGILVSLACTQATYAANALAIAIGLNSVDPNHYAGWEGKLLACENDARDMLKIAKSQQFQTVELLTKKATKKAVRESILNAAKTLKSGDILVLSYSGHGGQLPDANKDEPDKLDETWCLFDGEIVDDELASMWSQFADGVRIVLFSDSCHSGTIQKAFESQAQPQAEDKRPREVPTEVQEKVLALPENVQLGKDLPSEKESKTKTKATVILISACQDDQLALDGTKNGRFTEGLIDVWNNGSLSGGYPAFHKAIAALMPSTQTPNYQVYGAKNTSFEGQKPWSK